MSKSKQQRKSGAWLERQNRDHYVRQARRLGLRGRAVFKLEEIDKKYRLIRPGDTVIDIGSAPGSWSQYLSQRISRPGRVIAIDLLAMPEIENVNFIQGDFTNKQTLERLCSLLGDNTVDLVLSDMAPNMTGIADIDQARHAVLVENLLGFCRQKLATGRHALFKLFAGEAANMARIEMQQCFAQFRAIKPGASRAGSREVFFLGRGYSAGGRGRMDSAVAAGVKSRDANRAGPE